MFLKVKNAIDSAFKWFAMILLAGMAILMAVQIFLRYIGSPFFWVEEFVRLAQISIVFLVSPLVLQRGEHFSYASFPDKLPTNGKKFVWILSLVLVILVSFWIFYYGSILVPTSQYVSANGIPRYVSLLPAVIGGFWTIVLAGCKIVTIIRLTPEEAKEWKL